MFVDACAIISIIAGEESAVDYEAILDRVEAPFTSPLAAWEAIIVLSRPDQLNCRYSQSEAVVTEWLDARNIEIREPTNPRSVLSHAVAVAGAHGIGKRHLSNFDCFHYAHAKAAGAVLLTTDQLLQQTDVETLP